MMKFEAPAEVKETVAVETSDAPPSVPEMTALVTDVPEVNVAV